MDSKDFKCSKCLYGKFDEVWGEWKCLKDSVRVYTNNDDCKNFKERTTEDANGTDDESESENDSNEKP